MLKKIFILTSFLILATWFSTSSLAVSPSATKSSAKSSATPSATADQPLDEQKLEQIKELRDRLATRVAQLREQNKRAWFGEIKTIAGTTITLTTKKGEKVILTDEETKFFRIGPGGKKAITLKGLVIGEETVAFGQADPETGQLITKVVLVKVFPVNINGKVLAVDTGNGTMTVQTLKRGSFIVDVETYTKILVWEKGKGLTEYGFSKIKVGDRVHVNGTVPIKNKEENRLTANRILVLPGKAIGITGSPIPTASPLSSPKSSPKPSTTATPTPNE